MAGKKVKKKDFTFCSKRSLEGGGTDNRRLDDGAGEERVASSAEILEHYGIDCETDLSMLDQDDFSKLGSRGMKPLHVKKLERWCEAVRERAQHMLPNTRAAAAVLSSEALNVVTAAAHSVGAEESECESGSENDSEWKNHQVGLKKTRH